MTRETPISDLRCDWVPHDSTKPPPALGPDFEVEALVCEDEPRLGKPQRLIAPVHEIPWDRVIAWRLP